MTEDQLQSKIFQHIWNEYPNLRRTFWAVPNGGSRNRKEAQKFKATGLLAGVHDLHFVHKGKFYTFELKVDNNTLSDEQKAFAKAIEEQGCNWYEVRTFDQFMAIFESIINN